MAFWLHQVCWGQQKYGQQCILLQVAHLSKACSSKGTYLPVRKQANTWSILRALCTEKLPLDFKLCQNCHVLAQKYWVAETTPSGMRAPCLSQGYTNLDQSIYKIMISKSLVRKGKAKARNISIERCMDLTWKSQKWDRGVKARSDQ